MEVNIEEAQRLQRNTSNNINIFSGSKVTSKDSTISFHGIPSEALLRASWLKALSIQDTCPPDSAVVCSQHFVNDDFYVTECGLRQICLGTIPSTVQITMDHMKAVDGAMFKPDPCIVKIEYSDENKSTELDETGPKFVDIVVKQEESFETDVDIVVKQEDSCETDGAWSVNEDLTNVEVKIENSTEDVLDNSDVWAARVRDGALYDPLNRTPAVAEQTLGAQYPIKCESDSFQCTFCFVEFYDEHELNEHLRLHLQTDRLQNGDTAASSSGDSSHITENRQAVRKLIVYPQTVADSSNTPYVKKRKTNAEYCKNYYNRKKAFKEAEYARLGLSKPIRKTGAERNRAYRLRKKMLSQAHKPTVAEILSTPSTSSSQRMRNFAPSFRVATVSAGANQPGVSTLSSAVAAMMGRTGGGTKCGTQNHHAAGGLQYEATVPDAVSASGHRSNVSSTVQSEEEYYHYSLLVERELFTCDVCRSSFNKKSSLVRHIQSHAEVKQFSCQVCHYQSICKDRFAIHLRTHGGTNGKIFSCEFCDYVTARSRDLARHRRTHTGDKPYTCKLCDYRTGLKSTLVKHLRTHTGEKPYACKFCDYKAAERSSLVSHIRTHTGEKPYSCNLCEYKTAVKSSLVKHTRIHTGEKPYSCKFCDYSASEKNSLVSHIRTHTGEKPYSCTFCDYRSGHKGTLVKHIRIHTGEKPYSCKFCDYKAAENGSLVSHMRSHTGEKPYSCKLCDYRTASKGHLVCHMRTHTGEKPFACKLCDYRTAAKNHLVCHMRTHTGEKPYSCTYCEYRTATQGNLVKHVRTHTGEKPYSCELCNYRSARNHDLISHLKIHS